MTTNSPRTADEWATWFWGEFFTDWLSNVQDGTAGVFDALDEHGAPDIAVGKSLLAQARTLFTVSHVALQSGDPYLVEAARQLAVFMVKFQKGGGFYRNRVTRDGSPTGNAADEAARSYDMSFVILGLVTWNKLSPSDDVTALTDACWGALQVQLTDPEADLLRNDDTGKPSSPAQNPHMHLYEACLQANQMSGDAVWLTRAADLRAVGLQYFMDVQSGSIAEFITPNLQPLVGAGGQRREVGHQCEWAWLLLEEERLSAKSELRVTADRLVAFADAYGFAQNGPLKGAAFDAVSSDGDVVEDSFLLWPQTEAIKVLAVRHANGDPDAGARACALLCLMFERWFLDRPSYVNQLAADGRTLWPQSLTRLMYHVVLALTEGSKAGLWSSIPHS